MPERETTGRTIRVIHLDQPLVVVLGVNELHGLDGDDLIITNHRIGDNGQGMLVFVSAKKEADDQYREFQVYFDKDINRSALNAIAKGARIAFISAPSPFKEPGTTAIDPEDFFAVIKEYGGCYIDLFPKERETLKVVYGV